MSTAAIVPRAVALRFASAVGLFLIAANVPYAWLIANFGYDDVLREPTGMILELFSVGGEQLVFAWLAFAFGALLFIPVAFQLRDLLATRGVEAGGATILGVVAAVAQAAGLLRWVVVVPALATAYMDPAADAPARQAIRIAFEVIHRFGGIVIGEILGQVLLASWTVMTVIQLNRASLAPRWLIWMGAITPLAWVLGLSELLHEVLPAIPSIEATPIAFVVWEAWLAVLAAVTLWRSMQATRWAAGQTGGALRPSEISP